MLNPDSIYTFQNAGSGKMLNLYGSASDGKNVVQYTADGSDEQRWKYTGNKLLTMRNTNFALDRYRGSGSYNNADVWTESSSNDDDQKVFIQVNSNTHTCRIILLSTLDTANQLCLTAYGSGNGTASGKSSTSNGNVFWAAPTYDDYQNWYYTEEGSSSGGETPEPSSGKGNGTLNVGYRPSTLDYSSSCYTQKFQEPQCTWHTYGRTLEVLGKHILFSATSNLHAQNWWNYVTNCTKSQTPVSNCIAVWSYGEYGHVAYVEKVDTSGNIYFTESNCASQPHQLDDSDGIVKKYTASQMSERGATKQYKLLGYLIP